MLKVPVVGAPGVPKPGDTAPLAMPKAKWVASAVLHLEMRPGAGDDEGYRSAPAPLPM
jgi:hypothetical protein